jgi:hypothetical protein
MTLIILIRTDKTYFKKKDFAYYKKDISVKPLYQLNSFSKK